MIYKEKSHSLTIGSAFVTFGALGVMYLLHFFYHVSVQEHIMNLHATFAIISYTVYHPVMMAA